MLIVFFSDNQTEMDSERNTEKGKAESAENFGWRRMFSRHVNWFYLILTT